MKRILSIGVVFAAACGSDAPPPNPDAAVEPDPLEVTTAPPAGSLTIRTSA
jgi:hypothetical protein